MLHTLVRMQSIEITCAALLRNMHPGARNTLHRELIYLLFDLSLYLTYNCVSNRKNARALS